MASVINSARQSTASAFDFIGNTANAANQLLGTATRAIDALDAKASLMHAGVTSNVRYQLKIVDKRELYAAAQEYTDLMEDINKRNYPTQPFDREAFFTAALKELSSET